MNSTIKSHSPSAFPSHNLFARQPHIHSHSSHYGQLQPHRSSSSESADVDDDQWMIEDVHAETIIEESESNGDTATATAALTPSRAFEHHTNSLSIDSAAFRSPLRSNPSLDQLSSSEFPQPLIATPLGSTTPVSGSVGKSVLGRTFLSSSRAPKS
jgi:hypothetical protein